MEICPLKICPHGFAVIQGLGRRDPGPSRHWRRLHRSFRPKTRRILLKSNRVSVLLLEPCGWLPTLRVIDPGNVTPPDDTLPDSSSIATSLDTAVSVATSTDVASEETAVSDPPPDVAEDPSDPDILVLGFQELDLSTEALLYSTKTAREDAWCTAIFAGLGEKAVLYEKVRVNRPSWSNQGGGYAGVRGSLMLNCLHRHHS